MENTTEKAVESVSKINYQFTQIPTKLIYLLDSDCFKLLALLIQENSYWSSKNKLDNNGYFFKSIEEIQEAMFIKNSQDVRLTIESLYINKIIDVIMLGRKHQSNKFRINWDKIEEFDKISITDISKFYTPITKMKRGTKCTYTTCTTNCSTICSTDCSTSCSTNCTPTIYNINNIDILDNKENINNIYNKNNIENFSLFEEESANANNLNKIEIISDLSTVTNTGNQSVISTEIMSNNEEKQVNSPVDNVSVLPTMDEINKTILDKIEKYFNPTVYNDKGFCWYQVIDEMQYQANKIREFIKINVADINIKNTYLSTINKICDSSCNEIRDINTNESNTAA